MWITLRNWKKIIIQNVYNSPIDSYYTSNMETSTINRIYAHFKISLNHIPLNSICLFIGTCNIPGMFAMSDTDFLYNCTADIADQRLYTIYSLQWCTQLMWHKPHSSFLGWQMNDGYNYYILYTLYLTEESLAL